MPFQRLPESIQTLYAELLEQTIHAEAEAALLGAPQGSFVSKAIKGGTYWYLQRMEGDRKRQIYLGKESPSLLAWMEEVRQARAGSAVDEAQRARLVSMLAAGGAATDSPATSKVVQLLAESGVFRMGGVLVGTQAFVIYGNMLGVRFDQQNLRTQDVDLAQDRAIGIAFSEETAPVNVERVPSINPRPPSTSFKVRGRELRVDFLIPLTGPESSDPVVLPLLGVSAHPLHFLDYLIESPARAVLVANSGILVNVPDPARFAFYEMFEQATTMRDRRQAGDLLAVLLEDRPGDVLVAWDALSRHPGPLQTVVQAIRRLPSDVQERLASRLPLAG